MGMDRKPLRELQDRGSVHFIKSHGKKPGRGNQPHGQDFAGIEPSGNLYLGFSSQYNSIDYVNTINHHTFYMYITMISVIFLVDSRKFP